MQLIPEGSEPQKPWRNQQCKDICVLVREVEGLWRCGVFFEVWGNATEEKCSFENSVLQHVCTQPPTSRQIPIQTGSKPDTWTPTLSTNNINLKFLRHRHQEPHCKMILRFERFGVESRLPSNEHHQACKAHNSYHSR